MLLASSLKLFDVSTPKTGLILLLALIVAPPLWMGIRRQKGLPAFGHRPAAPPADGAEPARDPADRCPL